jgi:predicted amidophosphoribosyltransferase
VRKGRIMTITSARKIGRWIILKDEYGDVKDTVCSCCNASGNPKYKICPNCDAEMVAIAIEQKRRWDKRRSS